MIDPRDLAEDLNQKIARLEILRDADCDEIIRLRSLCHERSELLAKQDKLLNATLDAYSLGVEAAKKLLAERDGRIAALEAELKRWETQETDRAVCCANNEERVKDLELLLLRVQTFSRRLPRDIARLVDSLTSVPPPGTSEKSQAEERAAEARQMTGPALSGSDSLTVPPGARDLPGVRSLVIRTVAEAMPSFQLSCHQCLLAMRKIEPFLWRCECGEETDYREGDRSSGHVESWAAHVKPNSVPPPDLVDDLWAYVQRHELTLRQLSKLCGVSPATLSRVLRRVGDMEWLTAKRIQALLAGTGRAEGVPRC